VSGILQINVEVPVDVTLANPELTVRIGDWESPPGVTLNIAVMHSVAGSA
jgi:hypothetical protein